MTLQYVPYSEFERLRALDSDSPHRAAAFAAACRVNVLYMIARAGSGHIGTSFSCIDLVSWLHLEELRPEADRYFSSKGHDAPALYAVLIGLGLLDFELLHRLRRLDGLPGHPDVGTPGIVTNTGSLGMGVSKAKGFVTADRLAGRDGRVYVLTGDGELQEGQFWESLAGAVAEGMSGITVIVDHNKLQSDTWVAEVSDLGDLEQKVRAFGWDTARCDGHDLPAVATALRGLGRGDRPGLLVADTVKGKGVSFMEPHDLPFDEGALYGFHSGAPGPRDYERALAELVAEAERLTGRPLPLVEVEADPPSAVGPGAQRLVRAYGRALVEAAEADDRIVALDADLLLDTGLVDFRRRLPDRFVECGIAEQDMVSTAGALALAGNVPFVHSFACFLSTRPNEQIYNNATEGTKVVYVGSLAGVVPGGPGHSHQSVRDISALAAVPGLILVEPCTEAETAELVFWAARTAPGSVYIRLVSVPIDVPFELPDGEPFEGRGSVVRPGRDAVFVGAGPVVLTEAWHAAEQLADRGLDVGIVELPFLNRVDGGWLREAAGDAVVFTLDNHYVQGGQGDAVLAALARTPQRVPRVVQIGLTEIPRCGRNDEVLRAHGLDATSLTGRVSAELGT